MKFLLIACVMGIMLSGCAVSDEFRYNMAHGYKPKVRCTVERWYINVGDEDYYCRRDARCNVKCR